MIRSGAAFCLALAVSVGLGPEVATGAETPPGHGGTLQMVRQRGLIRCGITENGRGLATLNEAGRWIGFFPDFCRAVATATTGSIENVDFISLSVGNRFEALREGAVDLLSEASTWTLTRDAGFKLSFSGLMFFDGQGFMTHRSQAISHVDQLRNATVCVQTATTTVTNTRDYDRVHRLNLKILEFETVEGTYAAFFSHQCHAVTDDSSALVSVRYTQAQDPSAYVILPEVISKEPLEPVVRDDDPHWADIVRWVVNLEIAAEEKGLHSGNVETLRKTGDAEVRRMLGSEPGLGATLGLDEEWGYRVIRDVGNYGEMFDRNLGEGSPLKLGRGLNSLWTRGGLLWSPPFR